MNYLTCLRRIKELKYQAESVFTGDSSKWRERDVVFWEAYGKFENELGKGLTAGKMVKWSVADNYAYYFVVAVGVSFTEVMQIRYGDCWCWDGVFEEGGKLLVPTQVAKIAVEKSEKFEELLSR